MKLFMALPWDTDQLESLDYGQSAEIFQAKNLAEAQEKIHTLRKEDLNFINDFERRNIYLYEIKLIGTFRESSELKREGAKNAD